jgi:glutamyl-Q tRNA(Asp) synthetase
MVEQSYRGRFAPTPSGPLHLGSLLTAVASYLQAKSSSGRWLLRMDDLDAPRCPPGAADMILRQLEAHALLWDESIRWQSACLPSYEQSLNRLRDERQLYPCACTRALLEQTARPGPDGPIYPGTCRDIARLDLKAVALRFRVTEPALCFEDGWQGRQCRKLVTEVGDFVVQRADGQIAYQLACAVDEASQGITEVVRGSDLLGSSFRQLALMQALNVEAPRYRHLPILVDNRGLKLSKQNHASAVDATVSSENLSLCLRLLGQAPPREMIGAGAAELLIWAINHWRADRVSGVPAITLDGRCAPQHPSYNASQQNEALPE